jgi:hypothetical protein
MPEVVDVNNYDITIVDEDGNDVDLNIDYTMSREGDDTFLPRVRTIRDENGDELEPDDYMVNALRLKLLEDHDYELFDEDADNDDEPATDEPEPTEAEASEEPAPAQPDTSDEHPDQQIG